MTVFPRSVASAAVAVERSAGRNGSGGSRDDNIMMPVLLYFSAVSFPAYGVNVMFFCCLLVFVVSYGCVGGGAGMERQGGEEGRKG